MKKARERVHGTGPTRKELKPFAKLGTLPMELVMQLRALAASEQRNDLGGDDYTLPSNFDLAGTFNVTPDKYRQVLFQAATVSDPSSELEYHQWQPGFDAIRAELDKYFNRVYRFRLSVMQPHHEIPFHIDTDTSVSCRAQICLNNGGAKFIWKIKDHVEVLNMGVGDLYFINTGWPHSVQSGPGVREVAIFGFQYSDLHHEFQELMRCTS